MGVVCCGAESFALRIKRVKNAEKHLKQLDLSQMIGTGISLRMFSFEEKEKQQRLAMGMIQWPPFYIYVFAHCTIVF